MTPASGILRRVVRSLAALAVACGTVHAGFAIAAGEPSPTPRPSSIRVAAEGPLMLAFEEAPALLVAEVQEVTRLLHGGWLATLVVEQSLRPLTGAPDRALVAWEEPVPSLPARLVRGRRVLVALGPLPSASIWRDRIPEEAQRARTFALAARGAAWIERPTAAELDALGHYLALSPEARAGEAGVAHLAAMAASAGPVLAHGSLERLRALPDLDAELSSVAARALVRALLRRDGGSPSRAGTPSVGRATLRLVESRRPPALRAALLARIAAEAPDAPGILYGALGAIDGGLPEARSLELLASPFEEQRRSAARWARGPKARDALRVRMREDEAPAVRAAAVERLVALESEAALSDAMHAFEDPAPSVRLSAVRSISTLGAVAVPQLRKAVEAGSDDAAKAAIATLSLMGDDGHRVLAELAMEHPDPTMRTLAGIAIGQPIGHQD